MTRNAPDGLMPESQNMWAWTETENGQTWFDSRRVDSLERQSDRYPFGRNPLSGPEQGDLPD